MNSKYNLIFSTQASKFLKKLKDKKLLNSIIEELELIRANPYVGKFLQGDLKGYHSYRIRTYRIIYKIINSNLLVYIEHISHRKESY
ncbi:MAG: hypothetical protein FD145_873 [Candidatus Saganbacteria bacterium]|uniref:Type II toxin-antitoxin system mRNA interferase toxin, RelE/StbE family n=1 Tax=Candidatus Saganbacteria bacterium TaxID=2575572 RepID=A0A833NRY8_UNCSA|nr:MAG: hypothetical protein FD145_873 [Candidatus Saganbacteria bacterium]